MDIKSKIKVVSNALNMTAKDKNDMDEYLAHNELGLAFEVICTAIETDKIKISQKDYKMINDLGKQMEMDNELWFELKNNIK